MTFLHPDALWWLLLVPVLAGLFAYAAVRRREALRLFGGALTGEAARARRLRRYRAACLVGAAALLVGALAGPRYGTSLREVREESLDLVVALDVSASMQAEDVAPSRLERATYELHQLLDGLAGDRVGLVLFAGEAFVQCPLTSDYGAVRLFLDAAGPDLVPTPGTDLAAALYAARRAFDGGETSTREPRPRALLVLSDGENHSGLGAVADELEAEGVALFAAGVGTEGGAPIPTFRRGRRTGYKADDSGQRVTSRLDPNALREIGRAGYVQIGGAGTGLAPIAERLAQADKTVLATEAFESYAERFQVPLALALLLLIAERLIALVPARTPHAARPADASVPEPA